LLKIWGHYNGFWKSVGKKSAISSCASRSGRLENQDFSHWQWSPEVYEWPILTAFVVPLVAQFLASKRMDDSSISRSFRMEFTGGGKKDRFVPPCLWKKNALDSVCIGKKFRDHYMCCDFLLLPPFPAIVAEVKVAVPKTVNKIFSTYLDDLEKCREWLKPDAFSHIQNRFGIERFDHAIALLVDLTGGQEIQKIWKASIDKDYYFRQGIFARLISPVLGTFGTDPLGRLGGKKAEIPIATQPSPSNHGLPSAHLNAQKQAEKLKNGPSLPKILEIALDAVLRCEETGMHQGVEIPLASWGEVHQFKKQVIIIFKTTIDKPQNLLNMPPHGLGELKVVAIR
jgi:hypothetical protein